MPRLPRSLLTALLFLLSARHLSAQEVLEEATGEYPYMGHGFSMACTDDVDGDGTADYWVGAPDLANISERMGNVRLLSGADGALLQELAGKEPWGYFGYALAAGRDLDGDGHAEVVVGAPQGQGRAAQAGTVYVRRVTSLRHVLRADASFVLYRLRGVATGDRFGEALAFVDDHDGDGVAELLVGAPGDDVGGLDSGSVRIVSGASGATLETLRGAAGSEFGSGLADVGDLTGDGCHEFLVGAPHGDGAVPGAGHAVLYSGATRLPLAVLEGVTGGEHFGLAVAPAGDANGDGTVDLAVGAPGDNRAAVFSGTDGALLWSATLSSFEIENYAPPGFLEDGFGRAVCAVGDQDGDGKDDLAIGYPAHSSVHVHSGADGGQLESLASGHQVSSVGAPILGVYFGYSLARFDDRNGDGRSELMVGAPFDFRRESGGEAEDYDVGAVALVSVATDPAWVREVRSVSGAGDIDGDGFDDIAYGYTSGVEVVSGLDGSLLLAIPGVPARVMARAGDVNDDGVEDLVLGDRFVSGTSGRVLVVSGVDGAILHDFVGDAFGDRLGTSVAGVGDLDGDGFDDFGSGAPLTNNPSGIGGTCELDAGYVRLYSGQTGGVLFDLVGEGIPGWDCGWGPWSEAFGFSLTGVGDWNEDGTPDIAVGAPGAGLFFAGEVRVFSGLDGALLEEFVGSDAGEFGISIDGGPGFDFDADGHVDLVIGEQAVAYGSPHTTRGYAHVFSGSDSSLLATFSGANPPRGYSNSVGPGYSVAGLEDFDQDGHSDVVFGNPTAPGPLGPGVGEVRIFSGADNTLLEHFEGSSSWDYLGYSVVNAGDTNGDGASDVLALALPSFFPSVYSRARVVPGIDLAPRARSSSGQGPVRTPAAIRSAGRR